MLQCLLVDAPAEATAATAAKPAAAKSTAAIKGAAALELRRAERNLRSIRSAKPDRIYADAAIQGLLRGLSWRWAGIAHAIGEQHDDIRRICATRHRRGRDARR